MVVRSDGAQDPASRIERLLAAQEARFVRAFFRAIQDIVDAHTLDVVEELLFQGRVEEALEALGAAADLIGDQYGQSFSAAARDTALFLSASVITVAVGFDQTNIRAVEAIRRNRMRLAREFSAEQRRATVQALQDGIARGANPREQAIQFRQSIGLTQRQQAAVENYRRLLTDGRAGNLPSKTALNRALRDARSDRSILRAIRDNLPLPPAQVERMVQRYRDRYIRYRSAVIARTEALRAVHEGVDEAYNQAIDAGLIRPESIKKIWVSRRDDRVRGSHVFLDGQERGVGETWQGFFGELRYPGDPLAPFEEIVNCRCVLRRSISGD